MTEQDNKEVNEEKQDNKEMDERYEELARKSLAFFAVLGYLYFWCYIQPNF